MKKLLLLVAVPLCSSVLIGLQAQSLQKPGIIMPSGFRISKPLRDLPVANNTKDAARYKELEEKREQLYKNMHAPVPGPFEADPLLQRVAGGPVLDTPLVNFDASPLYNGFCPTDPDGAVSPKYYAEVDNCDMAVYDKNGNVVMAPRQIGWIWDSSNLGDPVVLYDKFADRWFISQLRYDWVTLDVAVSVTNDPTGAYYIWYYNMGTLPDYPKFSIWPDGYYMTYRGLGNPEWVNLLPRSRMLHGSPNAPMISDTIPYFRQMMGNNRIADCPKTLDCDGNLPAYGTPQFLFFFQNIASGGPADRIMIYKLHADTTAQTLAITKYDSLYVASFDSYFGCVVCGSISQPGYPQSLDALDGQFDFRVPYMRFTGYSSVVLSNTVNTGGNVAGIRWYELRLNDTTLKWSIFQQGTFAPADGVSRWNSSIGMNYHGDIALAYTASDSLTVFPSIRYTGRLAGDPSGMMTFAEQTAIKGTSAQGWSFRWGDYSCTDVDPGDGITFWHTNCYVAGADTQHTRVFSFRLDNTAGVPTAMAYPNAALTVFQNGSTLNVIAAQIPGSSQVNVALFSIDGKQLTSQWLSPEGGKVQTFFQVGNLPTAPYFVRVGNMNFQTVQKVILK